MTEYSNDALQASANRHLWMHFTPMKAVPDHEIPVIVRGEGVWVYDNHGRKYLDGLSGLFTSQLGHGRRELVDAAAEQAGKLAYFPVWSYAHPKAVELAEKIADLTPGDLNRIFFTTGGSEAVESAWKLARQYFKLIGQPQRTKVISRSIAYHGATMGALSITGVTEIRSLFEPLVPGAFKVPNTNFYRAPYFEDDVEAFGRWAADAIEEAILAEDPETVAAVFLEPVQNAGGCFPPPPGYFQRVREICDRHGVLLVSDEVICAWGRLGHFFGSERYDFVPDMITMAKGLTSGYSPLGALAVSDRLVEPFLTGPTFLHGITFAGHPVSAAVALANIDVFEKEGILDHVREHEAEFRASLETLLDLPIVGDVRGAGYFYGIELVKDRDTKETFDEAESEHLLRGFLSGALYESGLICRADDRGDPVVQLAPPLICGPEEFEYITDRLRTVLTEAWKQISTPPTGERYRRLSLWWDGLPGPIRSRPALPGDIEADVAIVGGGLTGLWAAYYLGLADPGLRIAVIERDTVGFGASGRNGGWCSALCSVSESALDARGGPGSGRAQYRALEDTVGEVGRVVESERIDCGFHRGGTVVLARSASQLQRAHDEIAEARSRGIGEDDLSFLSAADAAARVGARRVLGGTYTPHCASLDPARLVRGLADVVEARGVTIYEQTAVDATGPGRVDTARGTVRADVVVRATEGYTRSLAGQRRRIVPVYSLMIATEPLPETLWAEVGLADRETFSDFRHVIIYGQRTEDGRLAFGGRGAPYHFGSAIRPEFDRDHGVHDALHRTLVELFPGLADTAVTHRWGGPLGIARDWFPSVGFDGATRTAWAGGYVGDGVSTTNLAGRTLRDLILGHATELTSLPWVNHRSRPWEPEPLRYVGINAGLRLAASADRAEDRAGRATWHSALLGRLVGG